MYYEPNPQPAPTKESEDSVEETGTFKDFTTREDETVVKEKKAKVEEERDDMLFYSLCAAAGILILCIICICYKCRNKGKI